MKVGCSCDKICSALLRKLGKIVYNLQSIVKELVHLGKLGGDGKVDGTVADLDNKAADDVGVDLFKDWSDVSTCPKRGVLFQFWQGFGIDETR